MKLVSALLLLAAGGCRLLIDDQGPGGKSPLQPATAADGSATLEIYWVRYSPDDPALSDEFWSEIDESKLAPAIRQELAANGFRVGVVGAIIPDPVAALLARGAPPKPDSDGADSSDQVPAGTQERTIDLLYEPLVRRRTLQLERGRRAEVQASDRFAELPLLVSRSGELGGRTYCDAQALYALGVDPQPDGSTTVTLTPELHYGPPRLRWIADDGILRQQMSRDVETFDKIASSVRLSPGEMLLVTGLPEAKGRLGHCFHSTSSLGNLQQKLILIRVANVPPSTLFAN
jgi:hypothetical protein